MSTSWRRWWRCRRSSGSAAAVAEKVKWELRERCGEVRDGKSVEQFVCDGGADVAGGAVIAAEGKAAGDVRPVEQEDDFVGGPVSGGGAEARGDNVERP